MLASMTGPIDSPAHKYVRQARRLRHVHAGQPHRLYQSLRGLSIAPAGQGGSSSTGERGSLTRRETGDAPGFTFRRGSQSRLRLFTQLIEAHLDGPVLRYSNRLRLLELADRLRLPRFEASLLIAAVQHERSPCRQTSPTPGWRRGVVAFLTVQSVIALLLAWVVLA